MLLSHHLPRIRPLFSSESCPSRESVHSCVTCVISQSHSKIICLFWVSQTCLPEAESLRAGSHAGDDTQQDRLCATCRQGLATVQVSPAHSHLRAFASTSLSLGHLPPKPQPCWLLYTITSQLKCHPDLQI